MRTLITLLLLAGFAGADDGTEAEAADAIAKQLASPEDSVVLAGLLEAAGNQSKSLTTPVTKLLRHKNPAVRQSAIEVLGGRRDPSAQKKAASALCARLDPLSVKEEDKPELEKVITALHDLAQPSSIKPLLGMKSTAPREIHEAAAMAVANVPSKEAIDRLIQYGYKDRRGSDRTRDIAVKALRYATQEQIKGGIEVWRKWWSEHEKDFDPVAAMEKRAKAKAEADEKKERRKNRKKKKEEGAEG
jgi:HEAT repeat protein